MLLNLLSGMLDILTGAMSRATANPTDGQDHRGTEQQNYTFYHNR